MKNAKVSSISLTDVTTANLTTLIGDSKIFNKVVGLTLMDTASNLITSYYSNPSVYSSAQITIAEIDARNMTVAQYVDIKNNIDTLYNNITSIAIVDTMDHLSAFAESVTDPLDPNFDPKITSIIQTDAVYPET
jgi:hypothetical protein